MREQNRWVFSNALPRTTRAWTRITPGPFIYIMPPNHPFNRARAELAVAFADLLARAFDVPPIRDVEYYLTECAVYTHSFGKALRPGSAARWG